MKKFVTLTVKGKDTDACVYKRNADYVYYADMLTGRMKRVLKTDISERKALKGYSRKKKRAAKKHIRFVENGKKPMTGKEKALAAVMIVALLILSI